MKRLVTFSLAVACLGTFAAMGMAQTAAEAPRNTARPVVTGDPTVGRVLTANPGTWTGDPAPTFTYRWLRCNRAGLGCVFVAQAAGSTYTVRPADAGNRIRAAVTGTNTTGTSTVRSPATPVVVRSGNTPAPAGTTVAIQNVSLPQRLIVDRVEFSPNPVTSRATPISVRVHVSDTRGRAVSGALVFLRSTPILTETPPELATGADGWATFSVQPRPAFPLRRGYNVQFFVRARKSGENTLAGVSTRRLVQVATSPAA